MLESLEHIDKTILLAINVFNSPLLDTVFWQISEGFVFFPLWIFLIWYIFKQHGIKYLITAIVCISFIILFSDQSANFVKHSVQRYRPTHNLQIKEQIHIVNEYRGGIHGFFSSHAANTAGVALFLILILSNVKKCYRYLIFLWPIVIGYSRIYLGVHYPSDIVCGWLDGLLWGFIFYKVFQFFIKKWNEEVV